MYITPNPRDYDLPYDDWRPGQKRAIREALFAQTPHVVINAPTGSGKSLIAAGIASIDPKRHAILTATKELARVYDRAFDFTYDIKGMGNYECLAAKDEFLHWFPYQRADRVVTCDDGPCRSGAHCALKDRGCLYFDRYRGALAAQTVLTNYSYWFSMRRYSRGLGPVHRLICDEAHALPEELMDEASLRIPGYLVESTQRGWVYPFGDTDAIEHACVEWRTWAARVLEDLKPREGSEDNRARKQELLSTLEKLTRIDANWAWDQHGDHWTFEPIRPALLLDALATPTTVKCLVYLSATITPQTLSMLGIPDTDITYVSLPSQFALDRRPVYVVDAPRVDHKMSEDEKTYWVSRIDRIISQRLDRKGLIHTVSYERARDLLERSKHKGIMLAPRKASDLPAALERLRRASPPMILLSPSVTTGYDFPFRDAEYQIIAKLPFPDTRSLIMKARLAANPGYRDHLTTQQLQQMIGRVMRDRRDQGETFIVDGHAQWFLKKARPYFAPHVWEAIRFEKLIPLPPPPLELVA